MSISFVGELIVTLAAALIQVAKELLPVAAALFAVRFGGLWLWNIFKQQAWFAEAHDKFIEQRVEEERAKWLEEGRDESRFWRSKRYRNLESRYLREDDGEDRRRTRAYDDYE